MGKLKEMFEALTADIIQPCDWQGLAGPDVKPCQREAAEAIVFMERCAGGGELSGHSVVPVCKDHSRAFITAIKRRSMACGGCHHTVSQASHCIERIEVL